MKNLSTPILIACAMMSNSALAQTTQPIQTAQATDSSTNIGNGGNSSSQYSSLPAGRVAQWCGERLASIRVIKQDAAMAKMSGAGRLEVIDVYEQGLRTLARDQAGMESAYSLTHRAILRGIELSEALRRTLSNDEFDLSTRVHFLENYLTFIQNVAANLDIPYYIPYYNRGDCFDCAPDISEYELSVRLVEMARSQLSLVLNTLASRTPRGTMPVGNPTAFLVALEFATYSSAIDLESSLMAQSMACVVSDLAALNARLASWNSGNKSVYRGNETWAVRLSYNEADIIRTEIDRAVRDLRSYHCDRFDRGPHLRHRHDAGYPVPYGPTRR